MATIPLKDITFPGLDNTYTIPEIDNTLSTAGKAADAKKTGDELDELKSDLNDAVSEINGSLDTKADKDGYAENLISGMSEQLDSKNVMVNQVPYLFRQTGGDGADREYVDAIVGGTVNWNQLVENSNFADGTKWKAKKSDSSFSASNNVGTVTYNSGNIGVDNPALAPTTEPPAIQGHKYLFRFEAKTSSERTYLYIRSNCIGNKNIAGLSNTWGVFESIYSADTNDTLYGYIGTTGQGTISVGDTIEFRKISIHDLTAMFGPTIADYIYSLEQAHAGDGVAWFRKYFPKDYYAYNAGELKSVEGVSAHKMTGFNQWDGSYTAKAWIENPSTGEIANDVNGYNVTDYIRVLPNTIYYTTGSGSSRWTYFDKDKNPIAQCGTTSAGVFTSPSNAYYVRVTITDAKLATFCFNVSDPAKNGTYEPYESHSYPLDDSVTLRGIWKLDASNNLYCDGDIYSADGPVMRRYALLNLGTLVWKKASANTDVFFCDASTWTNSVASRGILCTKYTVHTGNTSSTAINNLADKTIAVNKTTTEYPDGITGNYISGSLLIKDSAYDNATAFATAMDGVYIVYPLATPTTEEATPYRQLQICDPNGTEEFVSTGIVPVGHETRYPENLRAKIEGLPWNFASLIAPTESTFTATRNYTTGALLIVNNILYKATANIANGATITPNTNVTATTLAEVIAAL